MGGTNAKPAYGVPQKLEAGGQPIAAPHHGDSQVRLWDATLGDDKVKQER
jgi:hypothetical protein